MLTPEPPARTLPFWTIRVELVPLPHRPPLPTSDTLQVPSNLAGSAKAEPDKRAPRSSASPTTVFVIMDVFLPVKAGPARLRSDCLELGERDRPDAQDADRLCGRLGEVDHPAMRVGTPVVDAHHDRRARALVRDPELGAERQGLVRGG